MSSDSLKEVTIQKIKVKYYYEECSLICGALHISECLYIYRAISENDPNSQIDKY